MLHAGFRDFILVIRSCSKIKLINLRNGHNEACLENRGLHDLEIPWKPAFIFTFCNTHREVPVAKSLKSGLVLALAIAFMLAANAHAGVTLAAARIGAVDVAGTARFYQSAFGMQEIMKLDMPEIKEIMLNFGATVEAAKANLNPWIVIMGRESNDVKEVPHLVLYVTDMKATVAAIKAAGGKVDDEPGAFGEAGMIVGFAVDPAGNRMELIQQKAK
jgi:predicted enzyme related to lactoylglutathione lyase